MMEVVLESGNNWRNGISIVLELRIKGVRGLWNCLRYLIFYLGGYRSIFLDVMSVLMS